MDKKQCLQTLKNHRYGKDLTFLNLNNVEDSYTECVNHFEYVLKNIITHYTNSEGVYESYIDSDDEFDIFTMDKILEFVNEHGYIDESLYINVPLVIEGLYELIESSMIEIYPFYEDFIELNNYVPDIPIDFGFDKILKNTTCEVVIKIKDMSLSFDGMSSLSEIARNIAQYPILSKFFKSQGYSLIYVYKYMYKRLNNIPIAKNEFLESILSEIENVFYESELTFLHRFNGQVLLDYCLNKFESLTIVKDTTCGLVCFYNGSGSLLEIKLEKDFIIPTNSINIFLDDMLNYSINEIYGFISSVWNNKSYFNKKKKLDK